MAPEDIIRKTIQATTQFNLSLEVENRMNPRMHIKSRAPGLRSSRQHELVASDTFFPSVTSDRGNTCSQLFIGQKSKRWEVFPLKSEFQNGIALQDYIRKCRAPLTIKKDNAQSELGKKWLDTCCSQCINTETTKPHHPWQNPCEREIGSLSNMVCRCMQEFKVPLRKHDWCQKCCVDVHNILAHRNLGWRTPMKVSSGHTPDISVFCFHIWEPIWYYVATLKSPQECLKKGRLLGIA